MTTVQKPIVLNETVLNTNEILKTMNTILTKLAVGNNGLVPENYADVQSIVRMGIADQVFSVGDVIEVARATKVEATLGTHTGITAATVDFDKFIKGMNEANNMAYTFTYDGGAWKYNDSNVALSTYGIGITGTPAAGDTIVINETATTFQMAVMDFVTDGVNGSLQLADKTKKYGMIMQAVNVVDRAQFDQKEAFYYSAEGMEAGTYNFHIPAHAWVTGDVDQTFQFTLTQAVPAGGQLCVSNSYNQSFNGANVNVYKDSKTTSATESVPITIGTDGTALGDMAVTYSESMNSYQRALLGSNRWATSAMRQYLNSDKPAGSVWNPQTVFDRPWDSATSKAGWMRGLDPQFLAICGKVNVSTILNTVCDKPALNKDMEVTKDTFFLPSMPEVYGGKENSNDNGTPWKFYSANSTLASPSGAADANRIKYWNGNPDWWWQRGASAGNAYYVRIVYTGGNAWNSYYAVSTNGVAVACIVY